MMLPMVRDAELAERRITVHPSHDKRRSCREGSHAFGLVEVWLPINEVDSLKPRPRPRSNATVGIFWRAGSEPLPVRSTWWRKRAVCWQSSRLRPDRDWLMPPHPYQPVSGRDWFPPRRLFWPITHAGGRQASGSTCCWLMRAVLFVVSSTPFVGMAERADLNQFYPGSDADRKGPQRHALG